MCADPGALIAACTRGDHFGFMCFESVELLHNPLHFRLVVSRSSGFVPFPPLARSHELSDLDPRPHIGQLLPADPTQLELPDEDSTNPKCRQMGRKGQRQLDRRAEMCWHHFAWRQWKISLGAHYQRVRHTSEPSPTQPFPS